MWRSPNVEIHCSQLQLGHLRGRDLKKGTHSDAHLDAWEGSIGDPTLASSTTPGGTYWTHLERNKGGRETKSYLWEGQFELLNMIIDHELCLFSGAHVRRFKMNSGSNTNEHAMTIWGYFLSSPKKSTLSIEWKTSSPLRNNSGTLGPSFFLQKVRSFRLWRAYFRIVECRLFTCHRCHCCRHSWEFLKMFGSRLRSERNKGGTMGIISRRDAWNRLTRDPSNPYQFLE